MPTGLLIFSLFTLIMDQNQNYTRMVHQHFLVRNQPTHNCIGFLKHWPIFTSITIQHILIYSGSLVFLHTLYILIKRCAVCIAFRLNDEKTSKLHFYSQLHTNKKNKYIVYHLGFFYIF